MATTYPYIANTPVSTNTPKVDQPNMNTNFQSINSLIGTDHVTFGSATGSQIDGMHNFCRLTTFSTGSDPSAIGSIGQLYVKQTSNGSVTDETLWFISGGSGGRITQLTGILGGGGNQSNAGTNGYTPLTGGLILQWGNFALTNSLGQSGALTYSSSPGNIAFPNNTFSVMLTLQNNIVNTEDGFVNLVGIPSKTSFSWRFQSTKSTSPTTFDFIYWIAIGN